MTQDEGVECNFGGVIRVTFGLATSSVKQNQVHYHFCNIELSVEQMCCESLLPVPRTNRLVFLPLLHAAACY